jgi:hypothetical protein
LTGIVNAFFLETVETSGTTTLIIEYDANGKFVKAGIKPSSNGTSARIRGEASLTYHTEFGDPNVGESGGPILYKIKGFKQSEAGG